MPSTSTDRLSGLTTSVAVKPPCKVAAITNITLSGEQTVNSVAVVDGDRVLVTAQTSSVDNGIWVVGTATWARAKDFDGSRDVVDGTLVLVGTTAATSQFWLAYGNTTPIVPGTSQITLEQVDYQELALRAELASTASTSLGDFLLGVKLNATGAVATTQHQVNEECVSVARFMSAAQIASPAGSNCSAAVQAAVDYCLHADRGGVTPILEVPFFIRMDSAVNIDRPVDTMLSEFRIRGVGRLGGFYTNTAGIKFFSSTIAHTTAPVSEWVTFEKIHFESGDWNHLNDAVDGDKFLRVKFDGCYFLRVRAANSSNYLQSYYFNLCQVRQWEDWFMSATNLYDVHANLMQFEQASAQQGKGFSSYDAALPVGASGAAGCSFTNSLFENCYGPFVSLQQATGCVISGNYFEYNDNEDIDLLQGTTRGVSITGNSFFMTPGNQAAANFYAITVGTCTGLTSGGNYTDGKLYDFTSSTAWASVGHGDTAIVSLYRGAPSHIFAETVTHLRFPATQVSSSNVNTLDDYEENDAYTPTTGSAVNCSSVVVTETKVTKVGRQVSLSASGTFTVTAGTTLTSFAFALPVAQGDASDPATGCARIASDGLGFVADTTGANATDVSVIFPANQVLASGAGQAWSFSLTYNAAT